MVTSFQFTVKVIDVALFNSWYIVVRPDSVEPVQVVLITLNITRGQTHA